MLAAGYAVQATLRLRAEEAGRRAEPVLATAVAADRWAGSHLVVAAAGSAAVLAVGGLLAGLAYGLRAGDMGGELPRVLGGALVQLPAVWVMAGVGAACSGCCRGWWSAPPGRSWRACCSSRCSGSRSS